MISALFCPLVMVWSLCKGPFKHHLHTMIALLNAGGEADSVPILLEKTNLILKRQQARSSATAPDPQKQGAT